MIIGWIVISIILFYVGIGGGVGYAIGELGGKKNGPVGGLLGAFFGPVGWIIVAVLPALAAQGGEVLRTSDRERIANLEAELAGLKCGLRAKIKSDDPLEKPEVRQRVAGGPRSSRNKMIPAGHQDRVKTYSLD